MADPVVHLTNGVPDSGTGNITTLGAVVTALGTPMQATGGSVTANAGTNLNTSSLALETGGNLAAAAAVLGTTAGAAVTTSATGTLQQYLRGIVSLLVSGITVTSHAVTNAGTFAVQAALNAGSNIIGKVGIDQTTDGTTNKVAADLRLSGTAAAAGSGTTTAATVRTVLATDSPGIIATGSQASPSSSYLSSVVAGDIAAAASDSGNPVKIGGLAKTANPTAVTDGQRVAALFDKLGKQVVVGAVRDLKGQQATTITASTAETTIVTAVASTFLDLYGLILTNSSATATVVTIKDSTAGTTRATIEIPAGDTRGFMLPVDSAIPQATVNTAWTATSSASITSLFVTALFVKNL